MTGVDTNLIAGRLAARVGYSKPSVRIQLLDRAGKLADVIFLGRGDPDLDTPKHVVEAAKTALDNGATHYTLPAGRLDLRKAITEKLMQDNQLSYSPEEVVVTVGGQEAVFVVIQSLIEAGDEVLLPNPRFNSYDMGIRYAGGSFVTYNTVHDGNRFGIDLDELRAKVTPRTKLMVLITPDNPTGGVVDPATIKEIAQFAIENDIIVLSDEIYEHFIYGNVPHLSIASLPGMRERTIVTNAFSKAYAMTGWRIGYMAGPSTYISRIGELRHTISICAAAVSQAAALAALKGPQDCIWQMKAIYNERRLMMIKAMDKMGLRYVRPDGAFYIWVDVSSTQMSAEQFCSSLLDDAKVLVFPGDMFGDDVKHHLRITLLAPLEQMKTAAERMGNAVASYFVR